MEPLCCDLIPATGQFRSGCGPAATSALSVQASIGCFLASRSGARVVGLVYVHAAYRSDARVSEWPAAVACGFGSLRRMDRASARTVAASPTEFRARYWRRRHVALQYRIRHLPESDAA